MDNITKNLGDMMITNNNQKPNPNSNPNNKPNPNSNNNPNPNPNNKPNPNPNNKPNPNPNKPNSNSNNNNNNNKPNSDIKPETKSVELVGKDAEMMLANKENKSNPSNTSKTNTKKNTKPKNVNLTMKKKTDENTNNNTSPEDNNTSPEDNNSEKANTVNANDDKKVMISLNKLTMNLLNHQIVIKLFHFQTKLFGAHKASDAYLEKFAQTMDKFLEIAQGIYGKITLKKYTLTGSAHSDENIVKHLDGIITSLRENIDDVLAKYTDLINVRDELVGDAEQLKYLLTFK